MRHAAGEQADHRRAQRDAGRGTVLGDGAGRQVHVQVAVLEEVGLDAECFGVRAHVGERRLRGRGTDTAEVIARVASEGFGLFCECGFDLIRFKRSAYRLRLSGADHHQPGHLPRQTRHSRPPLPC